MMGVFINKTGTKRPWFTMILEQLKGVVEHDAEGRKLSTSDLHKSLRILGKNGNISPEMTLADTNMK